MFVAADQFMVSIGSAPELADQRNCRRNAWIQSVVAMFSATYVVR